MRNKSVIATVVIIILLLLLIVAARQAFAQEPGWNHKVFLPMAMRSYISGLSQPTPTLTPTETPMPTEVPTEASTTTPVPTPTMTKTPQPHVHILSNHSGRIVKDHLRIVGEVQNNTSDYLRFVRITINVFNQGGQLLDTDWTYTYLDNLPPGEKTCFRFWLYKPTSWSYYIFENPTYLTDGNPLPNLTLLNTNGLYDPIRDYYKLLGQVCNNEKVEVRWVSPVGTLYDSVGMVTDCGFTYVDSTHLNPGQTSSFEMLFHNGEYTDTTSYRLQIDGFPQGD